MSEHRPEVADVIRNDGAKYLELYRPSREQYQVLNALADCRTSALGGHVKRCQGCGHEVVVYNSCRNRHCPKCQGAARAAWLEAREREVLDVEYFHVVFTIPHELAPMALQNRRSIYGILFRAASETLLTLGRDAKYFGAELGALAILHTWGQNLHLHPHLHCVVPGGGLSLDGERWVHAPRGFFLPVRVLARLFRGKFVAHLQRAFDQHRLQFYGQCSHLTTRLIRLSFVTAMPRAHPPVCYSDRTMIRVEIEETIRRPIEEVFERLVDIRAYPDWMPENGLFVTCTQDSEGEVAVGTAYTDVTRMGTVRGEVRELERPHKVVFHYMARLLGMRAMDGWPGYELEREDDTSTRVHHVAEGYLHGPFKLMQPIVQALARRERHRTVDALKRSLETSEGGGGAS